MSLNEVKKNFDEYLDKMYALEVGASMLHWDSWTGGPPGGLRTRGKAQAALQSEIFKMSISDEMMGYINTLSEKEDQLDDIYKAKLRICKKTYFDNIKIPAKEYEEYETHLIKAREVWGEAKNTSDFAKFAPFLTKNIEYVKRFVAYRSANPVPYNVLLDDYEPGLTTDFCDVFFAELKKSIVPLLQKITTAKKQIDMSFVNQPVPLDTQRAIGKVVAEMTGYDFNRGQLAETEHPFALSLSKYDSRITTHYYENALLSSFFSVMHECGHAIYEQQKMDEIAETLLDDGISMAIHESQSRFYENVVGRSLGFWRFAWPKIQGLCGDGFKNVTAEMMYEAANAARASLIRIEADELTYSLHIMVRYEIEKMLFNGDVPVEDLPNLWNSKYKEYLGVTPPDDKNGVLQDVHWSAGLFGYFPSYALGSAYSAQLLHYAKKDFDIDAAIESGDIPKITDWLAKHIHRYGSIYEPKDLFKKIAGEDLNAKYYVDYLEKKFGTLYEL